MLQQYHYNEAASFPDPVITSVMHIKPYRWNYIGGHPHLMQPVVYICDPNGPKPYVPTWKPTWNRGPIYNN